MIFYVESGEFKAQIEAEDWRLAAKQAILDIEAGGKDVTLGGIICISDTGFDGSGMGGGWMDTMALIKKIEDEKVKPDVVVTGEGDERR